MNIKKLDKKESKNNSLSKRFSILAGQIADYTGQPSAFLISLSIVIVWAITGPLFSFSDTWQLVINTGTTIITFLMVFLIQNSQNRDSQSIQIKLDELILSHAEAKNKLLDIEKLSPDQLKAIKEKYFNEAKKERTTVNKEKLNLKSTIPKKTTT